MDEIAKVEVAGKARFNYASVFVGRAEAFALGLSSLTGASSIYCNAEAQTTTAWGGGGLMWHLAQISTFLPANT